MSVEKTALALGGWMLCSCSSVLSYFLTHCSVVARLLAVKFLLNPSAEVFCIVIVLLCLL